jgi:protein-S-isoprenylcysteine O-methyltransferase Ste14
MNTARFIDILWLCFVAYWWISGIGVKKNARRNIGRWGAAMRAGTLIIIFALFQIRGVRIFLSRHNGITDIPAVHVAGVAVCILGLTFAIWARRHLGRNWGMPMSLKEGHELVTSGPYAMVRHPIYTGLLTALIGSMFAGRAFWMVLFCFCCPLYLIAARVEDRLMSQQFPNEYPEYKSRTKFLIPYLF